MFYRTSLTASLVVLALAACRPDDEPASVCPLTGPVRLSPPPDGWVFDAAAKPNILAIEDGRIAFTYDERDPAYHWQVDVCGGEPERAPDESVPYRKRLVSLDTPGGEVTYYLDELTQKILVDRDDLAEPRALAGLPAADYRVEFWFDHVVLTHRQTTGFGNDYAAGIGGSLHAIYSHDGDPTHPTALLADGIAKYDRLLPDYDLLALRDDGELLRIDLDSGKSSTLLASVRSFHASAPHLIWQELGDDVTEPVYLRDLDSGDEQLLLVNDFCQRSWGRDPEFPGVNAGQWSINAKIGFAGLLGPGASLAAMRRLDDGAAVEVPGYGQWERWLDGAVLLRTSESADTVALAIWDPATDGEHEWYRGAIVDRPNPLAYDGEGVDYLVYGDRQTGIGSLWRYELASGLHREVLPRMSTYSSRLDDGRYLVAFPHESLGGGPVDLVVIDRDTDSYTTLAERAFSPHGFRDDDDRLAWAWLDVFGPEPGLWVTPLPPK